MCSNSLLHNFVTVFAVYIGTRLRREIIHTNAIQWGAIMRMIFVFLILLVSVQAAPWFDWFGGSPAYRERKREERPQRQGKGGAERWKEICKVINPNGFAYPGSFPYPAAPVCPFYDWRRNHFRDKSWSLKKFLPYFCSLINFVKKNLRC